MTSSHPVWGLGRTPGVQKSLVHPLAAPARSRGSNGSFIPFETRFLYSRVLLHFGRRRRDDGAADPLSPLLPLLSSEAHVLLLLLVFPEEPGGRSLRESAQAAREQDFLL